MHRTSQLVFANISEPLLWQRPQQAVDLLAGVTNSATVVQTELAEQLSRPVDEDRLGGFLFGVFARSFDEFAVDEGRPGADQGDEVGGVHGPPAVLR